MTKVILTRHGLASTSGSLRKRKSGDLNALNLYQACISAWNAFRENKTIGNVKFDTKKGLYTVAA